MRETRSGLEIRLGFLEEGMFKNSNAKAWRLERRELMEGTSTMPTVGMY